MIPALCLTLTLLTAPKHGEIVVRGAKLDYVVEGQGTPCVVLGSSLYYPRTFSKNLRKSFRFYFVDLRWFAKEYTPVNLKKYRIESLLNDVEQIRRGLKLSKMMLMGHSIHGTIAFEYARKYPKHVSLLVLIGSPVVFGNAEYDAATEEVWKTASPERKRLQEENWRRMPNIKQNPHLQEVVENYVAMTPKYWYNPRYPARPLWAGMSIHTPLLSHLYSVMFRDYRMFGKSRTVGVPTLIVMGRHDYVIPVKQWEQFRDIVGLRLHVLEKSGHTPQLEEPEHFDALLLNWMKSVK